jgi:hypothetical protein
MGARCQYVDWSAGAIWPGAPGKAMRKAIDDGNALVDRGARQLAFLAGLESYIVEQCRFGEGVFGDLIGVVNTLPPAEKVQQRVRIGSQSCVGQTAKSFVV